jgi:DNA-binding LytR/AlgR family response regulator
MKIKCLIIDDEPPALKVLQKHIAQISGLDLVAQCKNAFEALEILQSKSIDLIFLDIKMPHLLGTDFLKSLANPPKVIFVTAYREYAVESYELDVVDYLLKPVSFERFLKAVSKIKMNGDKAVLSQANEFIQNTEAFIYLKVDKSMQKIILKYIESWKDYVKLYCTNQKIILASQSISHMENLLSEHRFIRVHRSYMVCLDKITGYTSLSLQINKTEIPIGRLYKQQVIDIIKAK